MLYTCDSQSGHASFHHFFKVFLGSHNTRLNHNHDTNSPGFVILRSIFFHILKTNQETNKFPSLCAKYRTNSTAPLPYNIIERKRQE